MFMDYLQKAPQDQHEEVGPYTLIAHVNDMPVQSKKQQFLLLGSISNYHYLPHPDSTSATEKLTNPEGHIGYFQHVLFRLEGSHNIPSSPWNRLMHYLLLEESFVPDLLIKRYLKLDTQSTGADIEVDIPDPPPPRPRKKRKQQKRIVSVSICDINASAGEDLNALLNCANPNRNLYQWFKEEMVMEGTLKWRHHENELEICIMTDYNAVNSNIIPGSFIHVTKQGDGTGSYFISCTCDIYKTPQRYCI